MEGGVAANVIAEAASAQVAIRLASGTAEDAKKMILDAVAKVDKRLELDFSSEGYGPVYIDSDVEGESIRTSNRYRNSHLQASKKSW